MKKRLLNLLLIVGAGIIFWLVVTHPLNWGVSEELGDGFVITSDHSLLYREGDSEYFVLPFGVKKYAYNTKWIIARTEGYAVTRNSQDRKSLNPPHYWIIDKETPIHHSKQDSVVLYINGEAYPVITNGLMGPMDSLSFVDAIKKYNIPIAIN